MPAAINQVVPVPRAAEAIPAIGYSRGHNSATLVYPLRSDPTCCYIIDCPSEQIAKDLAEEVNIARAAIRAETPNAS